MIKRTEGLNLRIKYKLTTKRKDQRINKSNKSEVVKDKVILCEMHWI